MIDMGIPLCHFVLTAKEKGLVIQFKQDDPKLSSDAGMKYVASYQIEFMEAM